MHNLTRKVKKIKIDFYEHGNISDNLEVDYYTPLTLTFKENSDRYDSEIFYYRFINQESSFVEIKVNSVTLKIIEIVIVSINKIEYQDLIVNDSELVNPIVSSDTFLSNSIITNNENFTFYISNNAIYFVIDTEKEFKSFKVSNHLILFVNKFNIIVGMYFSNFIEDQWVEIQEIVKNIW